MQTNIPLKESTEMNTSKSKILYYKLPRISIISKSFRGYRNKS